MHQEERPGLLAPVWQVTRRTRWGRYSHGAQQLVMGAWYAADEQDRRHSPHLNSMPAAAASSTPSAADPEPGDINEKLLKEISTCRYGVCYFSEPAAEGEAFQYRDNLNVVFEAAMLHALTNDITAAPKGWLPIREKSSPSLPFDFASQRLLMVPRGAQNELNVDLFLSELRQKIAAMTTA